MDLNEIVNEIITQFKPETEHRKVVFNLGKLPGVKGDRSLLKMAFENLISNALKFTSKKEIAKIEIGTTETAESRQTIFIRDNGAGFDNTYSDKLFGVFKRLHAPEEFEGTGIGLANVKQIILKHGGTIRAEGETQKGATFYIIL